MADSLQPPWTERLRASRPLWLLLLASGQCVGQALAINYSALRNWPYPDLFPTFRVWKCMLSFLFCWCAVAGSGLLNTWRDWARGIDKRETAVDTTLVASLLLKEEVQFLAVAMLGLCSVAASVLVMASRAWQLKIVTVALAVIGPLYSAVPLAMRAGVGELVVFVSFGPLLVEHSASVHSLVWTPHCIKWGLSVGLFAAAFLFAKHMHTAPTDMHRGGSSLATVSLGLPQAWLYWALVVAAAASLVWCCMSQAAYWPCLALVTLPLLASPFRDSASATDWSAVRTRTAIVCFAFHVLASIGILMDRVYDRRWCGQVLC